MILPGETEAGSAGMHPCRGIAWWARRDDDREYGNYIPALPPFIIGSKDPDASKIPARRAEYSLTENASFHFTLNRNTPAMAAGVDSRLWEIKDIVEMIAAHEKSN